MAYETPFPINCLFTGQKDARNLPIITMDGLRVAQAELTMVPGHDWPTHKLAPWILNPMKDVYNKLFKAHSSSVKSSEVALAKLEAHRSNGTWPQLVLSSYPGCSSVTTDSVLSSDTAGILLASFEQITKTARTAMLEQLIACKTAALKEHRRLASPIHVCMAFRDQVMANLLALEQPLRTFDHVLPDVVMALSLLSHLMAHRELLATWHQVEKELARSTATDIVMDICILINLGRRS
ncbi:unnamed protein product [Rhizopus stolonifer]